MNPKTIVNVMGIVGTVLSLVGSIVSSCASTEKQNMEIDRKVNEAVAKALKNSGRP